MIATRCDVYYLLRVEAAGSDKLRLSVARIVPMTEAAACSVAPGDDTSRGCQGDAVLESTADLTHG